MHLRRRACLLSMVATGISSAASAQGAPAKDVDLLLVLAVDASGSVDMTRFELQKHGYASAFRSAEVRTAIASGANQAIGVTMVQWTGPALHVQVVPWMSAEDAPSASALADAIDAAPRKLFGGGTSISGAIDYAMRVFAASPFTASRRVVDVSGDGANNSGRPAAAARDDAVAQGVTINGLPILTIEPDLDTFYRAQVIGGSGAFVIAIESYDQFADAIRRKLVTEIAARSAPRRRFG